MPVDPVLEPLLASYSEARPIIEDWPAFRRASTEAANAGIGQIMSEPSGVKAVSDILIDVEGGSIRLRVYTPFDEGPLPAYLYIHGGGWSNGSIDELSNSWLAQDRAARAGQVVVAVDYRKAPEHKYPTPLNDCYAALAWMVANAEGLGIRADAITVGGGSAGGNLSAALALKARDEGGPAIALQLLEIPALDLTLQSPSVEQFATGYLLTAADLEFCRVNYVSDPEQYADQYVSPLLAADLSGLPPAFIMSAEYDVVRDDGARYAARLNDAGVRATFWLGAGHVHGSSMATRVMAGAVEWQEVAVDALRAVGTSTRTGA